MGPARCMRAGLYRRIPNTGLKKGRIKMAVPIPHRASPGPSGSGGRLGLALLAAVPFVAALAVLYWGFFLLRDFQGARLVLVVLAIIWGVGGLVMLFTTSN